MKRYFLLCAIVLLSACGDIDPVAPTDNTPITDTFNVTDAVLRPDGSVQYVGAPPTITLGQGGTILAKVSFGPIAGCTFQFSMNQPLVLNGTNVVFGARGPGPDLAFAGSVTRDTFIFVMTASFDGSKHCGTIPLGGMPFPHTVVVTHP